MLVILDTHPVQYRVPVYQELARRAGDRFMVAYASDCSVRGYRDRDFGREITWELPLLEGYPNTVLNAERGEPNGSYRSLSGRPAIDLLDRVKPSAVLFTGFEHDYFMRAYAYCVRRGVPRWLRQETQDLAFSRGPIKRVARTITYRAAYAGVNRAFYIGELNRRHYSRHGIREERLTRSPYCVRNPIAELNHAQRLDWRNRVRVTHNIADDRLVVAFSGKFIDKKHPELVLESVARLPSKVRDRITVMYLGSGPLEKQLRQLAADTGVRTVFTGFLNQDTIAFHYLAADVFMLPSRRQGETWGLVVNEALHAGCSVITTDAVGSSAEFGGWERCRVISVGDAQAGARAIAELSGYRRDFFWAEELMKEYSIERAAAGIVEHLT